MNFYPYIQCFSSPSKIEGVGGSMIGQDVVFQDICHTSQAIRDSSSRGAAISFLLDNSDSLHLFQFFEQSSRPVAIFCSLWLD